MTGGYCHLCKRMTRYGTTLHRFPLKNKTLLKKWIEVTGISNVKAKICGKHFRDKDYFNKSADVKRLVYFAYPTLLLKPDDRPDSPNDLGNIKPKAKDPVMSLPDIKDSSCLFRCLSYYLFDIPNNHLVIRDFLAHYVSCHWKTFHQYLIQHNQFTEMTRTEYLRYITKQSNFGGMLEIFAFTEAFSHLSVTVENDDQPEQVTYYGTDTQSNLVLRCKDNKYFFVSSYTKSSYPLQKLDNDDTRFLPDLGISRSEIITPRIQINADGNCLFKCFSVFIFNNPDCYEPIRQLIVCQVMRYWNDFLPEVLEKNRYAPGIVIKSQADYALHMSRCGVFGGELEVAAFTHLFPKFCVFIYSRSDLNNIDKSGKALENQSMKPSSFGNLTGRQLILCLSGVPGRGRYEIIRYDGIPEYLETLDPLVTSPSIHDTTDPLYVDSSRRVPERVIESDDFETSTDKSPLSVVRQQAFISQTHSESIQQIFSMKNEAPAINKNGDESKVSLKEEVSSEVQKVAVPNFEQVWIAEATAKESFLMENSPDTFTNFESVPQAEPKQAKYQKITEGSVSNPKELILKQLLIDLSDSGFPVTRSDLLYFAPVYFAASDNRARLTVDDWVFSFLVRHPDLWFVLSENRKKLNRSVTTSLMEAYLCQLYDLLADVPPENIFCYDESNLTDNEGRKKVVGKRGSKYINHVKISRESSISIVMCGNATGEYLPPYILYKSESLRNSWLERGPPGAGYNCTKSGWMDSTTFEDWFENHLLVFLEGKTGPFIMIGDDVSSHINERVMDICRKRDIKFSCLPANSAYMSQPWNVGLLDPMETEWRNVLSRWKPDHPMIPQKLFAKMLAEFMDQLKPDMKKNLIHGFEACSIYPFDKKHLLQRVKNR